MIWDFILLPTGFVLLIKGADLLTDGASAIAAKLAVSEIAIGLTIVAFGTSTPELIVNTFSAFQGKTEITFGNIIGSNIVNIMLILGIAGLIAPLQTQKNTVWREIPFSLLAVFALFILCNDHFWGSANSMLTRGDGLILLLFFMIFLVYTFALPKVESEDSHEIKKMSFFKSILYIVLGLLGLFLGGKLVVDSAISIARFFAVSDKLIGLTIVAVGTSLPELFTSAVAARKGKADIAIGNVVGSNIFNIFFILGVSALIAPLPFIPVLNSDILILMAASFVLFFTMFTGKKRILDRWEAIILVLFYPGYTIYLILRG